MLPLAKCALEPDTLGYQECRNDAPLDLLAGFPSSFARSTVVQAGLTILSSEKTFPRLFTGPHPYYAGGFQRSKLQFQQYAKGPQNRQQAIGD
jgi:hypothetical protein